MTITAENATIIKLNPKIYTPYDNKPSLLNTEIIALPVLTEYTTKYTANITSIFLLISFFCVNSLDKNITPINIRKANVKSLKIVI